MERRIGSVYRMVQSILDNFKDCRNLEECYERVADNLTKEYVQSVFPELKITDAVVQEIGSVWRPVGEGGVYAFCCGSPVLYVEPRFDVGKPAIDRIHATCRLLGSVSQH